MLENSTMKRSVFGILFICILAWGAKGQSLKIEDQPLPHPYMIGDAIEFKVELIQSKTNPCKWPIWADSLGKFEKVRLGHIDTMPVQDKPDMQLIRQKIYYAVFDSGVYVFPAFKLGTKMGDSISSAPIALKIYSPKVDTTKAIHDIMPIKSLPFDWRDYYVIIAATLFAILALVLALWARKRWKKAPVIEKPIAVPSITPFEEAMNTFSALEKQKAWEIMTPKDYYSALSDTLRKYLENGHKLPAMEQTSYEVMTSLHLLLEQPIWHKLKIAMTRIDLIKFAKDLPQVHEGPSYLNLFKEAIADLDIHINTKPEASKASISEEN